MQHSELNCPVVLLGTLASVMCASVMCALYMRESSIFIKELVVLVLSQLFIFSYFSLFMLFCATLCLLHRS